MKYFAFTINDIETNEQDKKYIKASNKFEKVLYDTFNKFFEKDWENLINKLVKQSKP